MKQSRIIQSIGSLDVEISCEDAEVFAMVHRKSAPILHDYDLREENGKLYLVKRKHTPDSITVMPAIHFSKGG